MAVISSRKLAELVPAVRDTLKERGVDTAFVALVGLDADHFKIVQSSSRRGPELATIGLGQLNVDGSLALIVPGVSK